MWSPPLGQEQRLPPHFVRRYSFRGPGPASRIPHDDVTPEKVEILRRAEASGVSRVVLDVTSKPAGMIEWE